MVKLTKTELAVGAALGLGAILALRNGEPINIFSVDSNNSNPTGLESISSGFGNCVRINSPRSTFFLRDKTKIETASAAVQEIAQNLNVNKSELHNFSLIGVHGEILVPPNEILDNEEFGLVHTGDIVCADLRPNAERKK